ncbi:uncharacterized protein DNG_00790 [Cephalotrichum gorgonifer]|uniref:DUF3433 domain-containing protein n=1 Tax=Cephalotrichum gorgonifer TaxID=2041049 RepID=A0AAE8MQX4_9PEZI|nr:uncharacterized protein DNG_00790 [Cephalotrichum gorgonifer]
MSSFGNPSQNGANGRPLGNDQNRDSFSSRITNFAVIDISVDHVQFDGSSTEPRSAPAQQQAIPSPSAYPQHTKPVTAASPTYSYHAFRPTMPPSGSAQAQLANIGGVHIRSSDSAVSLQSQFDAQGQLLKGRESMVSIQSYYDPPTSSQLPDPYSNAGQTTYAPTSSWMRSQQSQGYAPISPAAPLPSSTSRGSRAGARGRYSLGFSGHHESIPEEGHDMALLPAAAPMGQARTYDPVPVHGHGTEVAFDPTSLLGPSSLQRDSSLKKLQEEEAKGHLTGGLGAGWKPEDRILGSELLRSPSRLQGSITRRFTHRQTRNRGEVLRDMGQEEANRMGKVIEVVIDEPTGVDISAMVGPEGLDDDDDDDDDGTPGARTLSKRKSAHIFFPQPNWKPFSMRWPYLSALIVLSIVLAILQEFIYRKSKREPLVSFTTPDEISTMAYFAVKFLPTIVSVTYGVLWQVTDFEVRRLEAFQQLSKPGGAKASESINVDYVTSINFLRPIYALTLKHFAVAASSLGSVLAISLVPTFGAASIQLTPGRNERAENPDMVKHVVVNATFSRLLTVTLTICAISASVLFFLLQTRRSGLLADVKGIAGLASMAVVSHILTDFKDMDTVTHEDIHNKLKGRRYILQNSALAPDDKHRVSAQSQEDERYQHTHLSKNPHPLMLTAPGFITYIGGVALFMGFVTAVVFTEATIVTDKAPWIMTALAVCIKLGWSTLDTDIRMMEPYYILSCRHAPPRALTLDYTAMPFGYMPWRAFRNGDKLMGFVGVGSVIAEVLTVLLTSLATVDGRDFVMEASLASEGAKGVELDSINSGQETVVSFFASLALALLILLYLTVVGIVAFVRRRHPFLPRQPNTIASVLAYIHQSKMLYDFVGTSKLNSTEMARRLEEKGKTYGLGWFQGRDGQTHCGVDEEELTGRYKHGLAQGEVNKPWATQWSVF